MSCLPYKLRYARVVSLIGVFSLYGISSAAVAVG